MPDKLAEFKTYLGEQIKTFSNFASKTEVAGFFKELIAFIKKTGDILSAKTDKAIKDLTNSVETLSKKLEQTNQEKLSDTQIKLESYNQQIARALKDQEVGLNFIRDKVRKIKEGKDGISPDPHQIALEAQNLTLQAILPQIPTIEAILDSLLKQGDKIVNGLELKIEDIGELREELDELRKLKGQRLGGGGGYSKIAADSHEVFWTTIGTGDGTTSEFTLTYKPDPISSLEIKVGNADMFSTDDFTYDVSTNKITFLTDSIPANGAKIRQKCKK